jgi:hypothetical protein
MTTRLALLSLLAAVAAVAATWLLQPPALEPAPPVPTPVLATPTPVPVAPEATEPQTITRRTPISLELATAARHYVDQAPKGFRADCSGFVEAILTRVGIPVYGSVAHMFDAATQLDAVHHNPQPYVGDLVFFHNTYDRNKNGKQDDQYSHIAVVVDVEPDGTIVMAHHGSKRSYIRMNLDPELVHRKTDDDGKVLNSVLKYRYDAPFDWPLRLTSQNWAAFATVHPDDDWPALLKRP